MTAHTPEPKLPKFWELAQARLANSPRTVNIKVSRLTCEMMIAAERVNRCAGLNPAGYRACVKVLKDLLHEEELICNCHQKGHAGSSVFCPFHRAKQALALAEGAQP